MLKRLAIALSLCASTLSADPKLTLSGEFTFPKKFGGLSGIEVYGDGTKGLTVSDRGEIFQLYMERENNSLKLVKIWPLPSTPRIHGDIEGIATLDGETFAFSLEAPSRVIILTPDDRITALPNHPRFWGFKFNKQLEALAINSDGVLYTLPENSVKGTKAFPLFAYKDDKWDIVTAIPQIGGFKMVGADFGPDGLLYLLERAVTPLGFRSRIRRFDLEMIKQGQPLNGQTLLSTWPSEHDNLEGISVWRDSDGTTRITMISDDNFNAIQTSEMVEYILTE